MANFDIFYEMSSSDEEEIPDPDTGGPSRKRESEENPISLAEKRRREEEEEESFQEQDFEDLLDDDEVQTDLRDWKLAEMQSLVDNFKMEMDASQARRPAMTHSAINRFLDPIRKTLAASEIPVPRTLESYVVELEPPKTKEYVDALSNIKEQQRKRKNSKIPMTCPMDPNCKVTFLCFFNGNLHILSHMKVNLYKCGAAKCNFECIPKTSLVVHIKAMHLDLKYECKVCKMKFRSFIGHWRHLITGHIIPTGDQIFVVKGPGKIKLEEYRPEWIDSKYGRIRQLVVIPWITEDGIIVQWSIGFTSAENIKEAVTRLWKDIENECKSDKMNEKWVSKCGSARVEVRKGLRMCPEESFSLKIYGLGTMAISQLKWYCREYLGAIHILATEEAQFFLSDFNDVLKDKLNVFKDKMPPVILERVEEFGESFAM